METHANESASMLAWQRGRLARRASEALEPSAVDAAMADESTPIVSQRGSRRDGAARLTPTLYSRSQHAHDMPASLESLADQIDLLHEQQRRIQRLLDRAGNLRIDGGNG